jgi:hypothetical protein
VNFIGQRCEVGLSDFSIFEIPEQRLGEREDRIGHRVDIDSLGLFPQKFLRSIKGQRRRSSRLVHTRQSNRPLNVKSKRPLSRRNGSLNPDSQTGQACRMF